MLHWAERRHVRGGEGRSTGELERGALNTKATLATRRIPNLQAGQGLTAGLHKQTARTAMACRRCSEERGRRRWSLGAMCRKGSERCRLN